MVFNSHDKQIFACFWNIKHYTTLSYITYYFFHLHPIVISLIKIWGHLRIITSRNINCYYFTLPTSTPC